MFIMNMFIMNLTILFFTLANIKTKKRSIVLPHCSGHEKIKISNIREDLIKRYFYREKLLDHFWKHWRESIVFD